MEFANDVCPGALLPTDIEARAHAQPIIAWQRSGLSSICRNISFESAFYPIKRRLTPGELAECARLFAHYEELLARYQGPYLLGSLSLADLMHVPTVIRLTRHRLDRGRWPCAAQWTQMLLAHPLVDEWMQEADQLPHIWYNEYLGGAP
jgi:glutathione S-transferase